jgi:hypothetical protein
LFILASTKLEIRAEQFLPGSEEVGGDGGEGGEMTQTLYTHMNKQKNKENLKRLE